MSKPTYSADDEYNKLVECYYKARSIQELKEMIREIPLEMRIEVLKRFDAYLVKSVLAAFEKSNNAQLEKVRADDGVVERIVDVMDNEALLRETYEAEFGAVGGNIIGKSLDAYIKMSNELYLESIVFKLANSLYGNQRFDLSEFKSLAVSKTSITQQVKNELAHYMELNIYRGRNGNNFNKEQIEALNLINPELATLVHLKKMHNGLERANYMIGMEFREKESLIQPENLGIDQSVMDAAVVARDMGIDVWECGYDLGTVQNMIFDKFFENSNIDKNRFMNQISDSDRFFTAFISNMTNDRFSIETRLMRKGLTDEMTPSDGIYEVDIQLFNESITSIKSTEITKQEEANKREGFTLFVPKNGQDIFNKEFKVEDAQTQELK